MRIIAIIVLVLGVLHVIKGWPEVEAYMSADPKVKADYLIAKTNRQPFEFPK